MQQNISINNLYDEITNLLTKKEGMSMYTNILETNESYELLIQMPGVKKENINIKVQDDYLIVEGKNEMVTSERKYLLKEISHQDYLRRYYLGNINFEEIKAKYENGLLKLTLVKPVKEIKKIQNIEIM